MEAMRLEIQEKTLERIRKPKRSFTVVHPLDDEPEEKVNVDDLGPMEMTLAGRLALNVLRGYMVLMVILVFVKVALLTLKHG